MEAASPYESLRAAIAPATAGALPSLYIHKSIPTRLGTHVIRDQSHVAMGRAPPIG